jgi:hypothetical protein
LIRPTVEMAVAFNAAVRTGEEWLDEPDEVDRLAKSLAAIEDIEDPVGCGRHRIQGDTSSAVRRGKQADGSAPGALDPRSQWG